MRGSEAVEFDWRSEELEAEEVAIHWVAVLVMEAAAGSHWREMRNLAWSLEEEPGVKEEGAI